MNETICIKCKNLKHSEVCHGFVEYSVNHKHYFSCNSSGAPDEMFMMLYEKDKLPTIKKCRRFKRSRFRELRNKYKMFFIPPY